MNDFLQRSLYRAEELYFDLTRPFRRVIWWAQWTWLPRSRAACDRCGAPAEWNYAPAGPPSYYCDACVPRGCSCNVIDTSIPATVVADPPDANGVVLVWTDYGDVEPQQYRDTDGRLLPCCEFEFHRWGWSPRRS